MSELEMSLKMNDFNLVDLSNPQWLERNIQNYTVNQVADILKEQPHIDELMQYHCFLMSICEHMLIEDLKEGGTSKCWKKILSSFNLSPEELLTSCSREEILQTLSREINNDACHLFPLFDIYRAFCKLSETDAVHSLSNLFGISLDPEYLKYQCVAGKFRRAGANTPEGYSYWHTDSYPPFYLSYQNGSIVGAETVIFSAPNFDNNPLYNGPTIAARDCSVFLTDSLCGAKALQEKYSRSYGDFIRKKELDFWSSLSVPPGASSTERKTFLDALAEIPLLSCDMTKLFTNVVWSSWFGGYYLLDRTDWTPLQNRTVYFFQVGVSEKEAILHFLRLHNQISSLEIKLSLVWLERKADPLNLANNNFHIYSVQEALVYGYEHEIALSQEQETLLAQYFRDKKRIPKKASRYLIDPIIRLNTFNVISGREGSGKTWVAMILGAALASRGKLFNGWEVVHKANVIYVADDEMDEDLLNERGEILRKLYRQYDKHFMFKSVHRINLLEQEARDQLEKSIDALCLQMDSQEPVVLILDHLNKLTNTMGTAKEQWPVFRAWVEDLNAKKITVILLHHEYLQGKMMGTVLIPQDADTHIHVEQGTREDLGSKELEILLKVPKNKGAKDQRVPYSVILDLRGRAHLRLPEEKGKDGIVVWKALNLKDQISQVKLLRQTMTMQMAADHVGLSKSSLEKFCSLHGLNRKQNKQ